MNAPTILDSSAIRQAALRLTVEQYHRLSEAAIVPEKTELLQGVIVSQMTKSPLHSYLVQLLFRLIGQQLAKGYLVRQEQPLTFADSEPEPDLAVVAGSEEDFRDKHPGTAMLVVEVAIATVEIDREKAEMYAKAGVKEYWLVLPGRKEIERYWQPGVTGYEKSEIVARGGSLSTLTEVDLEFDVDELFSK